MSLFARLGIGIGAKVIERTILRKARDYKYRRKGEKIGFKEGYKAGYADSSAGKPPKYRE